VTDLPAHEAVNQYFTEEHDVPLRQAAYAIGIDRVADAVKLRGYI